MVSLFIVERTFIERTNHGFNHLSPHEIFLGRLLKMPCYAGDLSSIGHYLGSFMVWSSSLVSGFYSVTQHCRTMARFVP